MSSLTDFHWFLLKDWSDSPTALLEVIRSKTLAGSPPPHLEKTAEFVMSFRAVSLLTDFYLRHGRNSISLLELERLFTEVQLDELGIALNLRDARPRVGGATHRERAYDRVRKSMDGWLAKLEAVRIVEYLDAEKKTLRLSEIGVRLFTEHLIENLQARYLHLLAGIIKELSAAGFLEDLRTIIHETYPHLLSQPPKKEGTQPEDALLRAWYRGTLGWSRLLHRAGVVKKLEDHFVTSMLETPGEEAVKRTIFSLDWMILLTSLVECERTLSTNTLLDHHSERQLVHCPFPSGQAREDYFERYREKFRRSSKDWIHRWSICGVIDSPSKGMVRLTPFGRKFLFHFAILEVRDLFLALMKEVIEEVGFDSLRKTVLELE